MSTQFEKLGGTYYQVGDYLLPNLALSEEENNITLGKWGMAHKQYLKEHKKILYSQLLISGKLMQHCKEIEDVAKERMNLIISQMAKAEGVTEQLKANNQMAWVREMNSIRNRAEEIIKSELICL